MKSGFASTAFFLAITAAVVAFALSINLDLPYLGYATASAFLFHVHSKPGWKQLLLAALMPQCWFFDSFTLWLIPKSRRDILLTAAFSWGAEIWRWFYQPATFTEVGRLAVIFLYLPMLAVLLFRTTNFHGGGPDPDPISQ